jgi:hypothetical protein
VARGTSFLSQLNKRLEYRRCWVVGMARGVDKGKRVRKNKGKGGAHNAFSSLAQGSGTKADREADRAKHKYKEVCSINAKEVEEVEAIVIVKRELTSNAHILEVREWVKELIHSRTSNTVL